MIFASVEELIAELRNGKMIVVVDDESRENEGDLIMPADILRVEDINFMVKHARGLVCLTLTAELCQKLNLSLMPQHGQPDHKTNFTVSIEAAHGVTTGISAADRTTTVKAAVNPDARPEDLIQPGHIFPLRAEPGGVLVRSGHTEAGCDFARLAGFQPASVIVEILNDDGSMARRDDLQKFAKQHGLKIGTIEDLISYRVQNEYTVRRVSQDPVSTAHGDFSMLAYEDHIHGTTHVAFVKGDIDTEKETLVRVHIENPLYDAYSVSGSRGWPLQAAMQRIGHAERGVLVILREPHIGSSLLDKIDIYRKNQLDTQGLEEQPLDKRREIRTYGIGAQILADIGVGKMNVMGIPRHYSGLSAFGLEIVSHTVD